MSGRWPSPSRERPSDPRLRATAVDQSAIGRAESKSGNGLFRRDRKVGALNMLRQASLASLDVSSGYAEWLTNISAVDHDFAEHRHPRPPVVLLVVVVRALIRAMISLVAIGPRHERTVHHDVEAKSLARRPLKNRPSSVHRQSSCARRPRARSIPDTACRPSIVR